MVRLRLLFVDNFMPNHHFIMEIKKTRQVFFCSPMKIPVGKMEGNSPQRSICLYYFNLEITDICLHSHSFVVLI